MVKDEHFVHLCQPDLCKSCGACCGLYNYADSSRESLRERLHRRTELFHETVNGAHDVETYSYMITQSESQEKIYEVIYCCEYLGFLDPDEKRVGCLLHPLQNEGEDLRDVSFYGRQLCDGHFCPSYFHISREEKLALLNIIDDWYLYGLIVTDIDLVKQYFKLISEGVGEMPPAGRFTNGVLKNTALRFFTFKISWPFRSMETNRFGKYYFDGSQYMIHHIGYDSLGCERSRFDTIFLSLTSEFYHHEEIEQAEALIQTTIDEFVREYEKNY